MLDWFKSHPWMVAIGCAIFLVAIISVIVGILTKGGWKDRGLMTTKSGKPFKWDRDNFPLAVWLHNKLPNVYIEAFKAARLYINRYAGAELFDLGTELPGNFQINRLAEGHTVIAVSDYVNSSNPDHGVTSLTVISTTGEIKKAIVTLPPDRNALAKPIVLHELMHVLGFDHDESVISLLHPQLQKRPQQITDEDLKRLKNVANTTFKKAV